MLLKFCTSSLFAGSPQSCYLCRDGNNMLYMLVFRKTINTSYGYYYYG